MALCKIEYYAESIQKHTEMNVLIPDSPASELGVLYLLHGLGNTKDAWCKWTALPRYHRDLNYMIVMPNASIGWYCNDSRPGCFAWEDHIIKDVIPFVERVFPASHKRAKRAIAGISMGGFGAVNIALRNSKLFSAVSGHASAFFFTHEFSRSRPELDAHAKAIGMNGDYDVFKNAERAVAAKHFPKIRFDCGQNDPLLGCNRKFHEHLTLLGVSHEYDEPAGIHDWVFADQQIPQTLRFASQHFDS